jgi:hypothetical protein
MPRLSVWYVRISLLYLAFGFTLGALMLWHKAYPLHPLLWRVLPMHMEILLVGWFVNLALGVAFWILPRWQTQRGDVRPAWAALVLLNLGVWLVALAPWIGGNGATLAGRTLEALGAAAFALHAWPRVKPWVEQPRNP